MGLVLVGFGWIWTHVLLAVKSSLESLNFDTTDAEWWGFLVFWLGVAFIISGFIIAYHRRQR